MQYRRETGRTNRVTGQRSSENTGVMDAIRYRVAQDYRREYAADTASSARVGGARRCGPSGAEVAGGSRRIDDELPEA
ncbi:MAG: hypothetical protein WCJ56_07290 [bacterium]